MGYTHYWTLKKNIPAGTWRDIQDACRRILAAAVDSGVAIKGPDGIGEPEFTATEIAFNGSAEPTEDEPGGEHCESFWIARKREKNWEGKISGWAFCKTAQLPYDTVCVAIGCALESLWPEHFGFDSDGDVKDWTTGLALARAALPEKGNQIHIPDDVIYAEQWQRHVESGNRYALRQHADGSFRITDNRVRLDHGAVINIDAAMTHARAFAERFSAPRGCLLSERDRYVDKVLRKALEQANADSRNVGTAAIAFAAIAGDHLTTR